MTWARDDYPLTVVHGDNDYRRALDELDRLRAEVAALRDRVVRVADQAAINAREVERMRPVIEAATEWRKPWGAAPNASNELRYAVDVYLAAVAALDAGEPQ